MQRSIDDADTSQVHCANRCCSGSITPLTSGSKVKLKAAVANIGYISKTITDKFRKFTVLKFKDASTCTKSTRQGQNWTADDAARLHLQQYIISHSATLCQNSAVGRVN